MAKLNDESLKAIVDSEIDSAMGNLSGELSTDRSEAMDRYLGEPLGTEMEGRSQVHTRDVMDVIEWIMPSLIRIFTDDDSAVEIEPVGPEDEMQARQETDYLNYLFYKKNNGFLSLYTWFKDALLQKNGVTKIVIDESDDVSRETYENLTDIELITLIQDPDVEVIEYESEILASDEGGTVELSNVTILRHDNKRKIEVDNIPPEEFLISRDARDINPKKARFTAHKTTKTVSDLKEMGFKDVEISLMEDGPDVHTLNPEKLSRYNLSDEEIFTEGDLINEAMRHKVIYECYIRVDKNGDGIAELLKVFRSGDFIQSEEVDTNPFNSLTPIILPHKYYGLSVADIIKDLQELRTGLLRSYMDNIYQTINGTTYYDENTVNIDDMLTSKPYGIRGVMGSPQNSILHIPPSGLPDAAFTLFELTENLKHQRIGDFQAQIDPDVLANAQTGAVVRLIDEAKAKTEMIARIFAETGVRQLFRDLHEYARKFSNRAEVVKLRNNWIPINPSAWRERTDFTVKVGLGQRSKAERQADANAVLILQERLAQLGAAGRVINEQNIYEASAEYVSSLGYVNTDRFLQNPSLVPPPPPQPDPNMQMIQAQLEAQMQIEGQKRQLEQQKLQVEMMDSQEKNQLKAMEVQGKAQQNAATQQLNQFKATIDQMKMFADTQNNEVKNAINAQAIEMEKTVRLIQTSLAEQNKQQSNVLDKYQTETEAATRIILEQMKQGQDNKSEKVLAMVLDKLEESSKKHDELIETINSPKDIIRDENNRIISIGGKKVKRNKQGMALGIE